MSAKIVQFTDFTGKYAISSNAFSEAKIQPFIDKYEKEYLYDLLGITLTNALLADITTDFTEPDTLIYQNIFNAFAFDDYNGVEQLRSNGIKEMLLGFIYWEYTRTQNVLNTVTGNVKAMNEVSEPAKWSETNIYTNYNYSVETYKAIQCYIDANLVDYADYNGVLKGYANPYL